MAWSDAARRAAALVRRMKGRREIDYERAKRNPSPENMRRAMESSPHNNPALKKAMAAEGVDRSHMSYKPRIRKIKNDRARPYSGPISKGYAKGFK